MKDMQTLIWEATREKTGQEPRACFCIGPRNGEPLCPCAMRMRGIFKRDGHWIEPEHDLGPVAAEIERTKRAINSAHNAWTAPHVLLRPSIYPDGTQWCCLLGEDLMSGVVGFGDTPAAAAAAFDIAWQTAKTPDAALAAKIKEGEG